jgi:hypothetical protein
MPITLSSLSFKRWLGLVNNLEVLQAQNVMQQTKHDYDRAVLDSKLNALTLNVVLGEPL